MQCNNIGKFDNYRLESKIVLDELNKIALMTCQGKFD